MSTIVKENAQKSEKQSPEKDDESWYHDTLQSGFIYGLGVIAVVVLFGAVFGVCV